VYAQGMALLTGAAEKYSYQLNLEEVAKIWRGGCIIRAKLLDDIFSAFNKNKNISNLLLDPALSKMIMTRQEQLRQVICKAANAGIPVPVFMSTLSYLDVLRSTWLPANLIQAQRDYFGAHTYERTDEEGAFHAEWEKK
jgi:6-phosphogluconate dehydrogenase